MITPPKRIGIFGGTFNPPHAGHLIVAESICDQLGLDKLFFVPSFISPHKKKGEEKLATHRLQMVRLAVGLNPRFDFSDIEIKRRGTSFTYTTVEAFRLNFPGSKLFLIIGADNYAEFDTWKNPERILELASLAVMNRPSQQLRAPEKSSSKKVIFASVPNVEISSSEIREMIHQGRSIQYLVPRVVQQYIQRHRLYR
ncbi:MAG TPA: nicotinate (nicotinamide) nucleotide adenylyltransferase [Bacteroidota bacterium]|nr:nicotinate (nicotinamide) nucleotide adenylyltransferase [Bacteroidota bacterium]